jgi:hypothetical protein
MRSRVKGCVMTGHRVRFFKHLLNSQGMPFRALQREIVITGAKTALEAEVIAEREFERVRQIPDWRFHADSVETEAVVTVAHHQRRSRPAGRLRMAPAS